MKIAIATNNRNKLKEIRAVLGGFFDEMLSLGDLGIDVEIEETGTTLTENALIKARTIRDMTGLASLADDSGLMCDALGGAPGVYSARYAGEEHDDAKNNALLLKNIAGKDRTAHFCSVIALCLPDGREYTAEGRVDGVITEEARGNGGQPPRKSPQEYGTRRRKRRPRQVTGTALYAAFPRHKTPLLKNDHYICLFRHPRKNASAVSARHRRGE